MDNGALLRLAREGDRAALQRLVEDNSGLVWSIARRYFGRGVEPEDLYQLGCMGLIKAARGFDDGYGTQFSTYAVPKIAGEIRRFLRDDGSIKVSRGLKEQAASVSAAKRRLEQRLGRAPRVSEVAAETGLTAEEVARCETAAAPVSSLQEETAEGGFTLEHVLPSGGDEERLVEHIALRQAVAALPEREKSVILLRHWRGMTQQAAAKVLGVSQVQVSRLERRAVEQLREMLS